MGGALQYQPDQEQRALAGALQVPLAKLLPIARLQRSRSGESAATWTGLADLGVLAVALDEAHGGAGLGATEIALIAIDLGRQLASPAVFATMAALGTATTIGAGSAARIAAALPGDDDIWIEEHAAPLLLVRTLTGATLHTMPAAVGVADDGIWGVRLMTGAIGPALGELDDRAARLVRLLDAAHLAGIAEQTLAMATDYATTREQFGRPIGSFQAVKHHCADMAIAARGARDLTTFAAVAIDTRRPDALHLTESAFLMAAKAAVGNAGTNIQIHGGIGFSAEADPHLFLKRARLVTALGGGVEAAAQRIAAAASGLRAR